MSRRISPAGLDLIKRFEGVRYRAYQDAVGVWTIGYGHTSTARPGMTISPTQAEELLRQDVERFEAAVERLVRVPLTQSEFDALVSFTFNVGEGALRSSTLLRLLHAGSIQAAADQFLRWTHAGGRELAGLVRRREAERALFLSPSTPHGPADRSETAQPENPDGPVVDMPTLQAPFSDTVATRLVAYICGLSVEDGLIPADVKDAQFQLGVPADGIVGPVTWAAMAQKLSRAATREDDQ